MSSCFYLVIVVLFFTSYLFLLTILKLKRKLLFVTDSRHRKSNMLIRFAREITSPRKGETFEKLFFIDPKSAENECKSVIGWRTIEE